MSVYWNVSFRRTHIFPLYTFVGLDVEVFVCFFFYKRKEKIMRINFDIAY